MKIELIPVQNLRPYTNNARTHSKKQIRQIAKSIEKFGFCNPVLIDDEGEIIAGHGRVEAAKHLGIEAVPTAASRTSAKRTTNSSKATVTPAVSFSSALNNSALTFWALARRQVRREGTPLERMKETSLGKRLPI